MAVQGSGQQPFGLCFNGAATARSRMVMLTRISPMSTGCFNGAATARSRMVHSARTVGGRDPRFNGAATARSRMGVHSPVRW